MPTYVYHCTACAATYDVEQRITEDSLVDCLECNAKATIKRVIQPVGVMFKGSGFHINDYSAKSAAGGEPTSQESPPAPTAETIATATEASKPEPVKTEAVSTSND